MGSAARLFTPPAQEGGEAVQEEGGRHAEEAAGDDNQRLMDACVHAGITVEDITAHMATLASAGYTTSAIISCAETADLVEAGVPKAPANVIKKHSAVNPNPGDAVGGAVSKATWPRLPA